VQQQALGGFQAQLDELVSRRMICTGSPTLCSTKFTAHSQQL